MRAAARMSALAALSSSQGEHRYRRRLRLASDRPHRLRLVHAAMLELSALGVTVPVVMHLGGYGFRDALFFDMALTVFYTLYAYVFHLAYDRLRPVAIA